MKNTLIYTAVIGLLVFLYSNVSNAMTNSKDKAQIEYTIQQSPEQNLDVKNVKKNKKGEVTSFDIVTNL